MPIPEKILKELKDKAIEGNYTFYPEYTYWGLQEEIYNDDTDDSNLTSPWYNSDSKVP